MIHIQFQKENLIKSPLNYTGGKFKLLEQILPLFPDKIDRFIDLFCGGCNVGINVQANKIICNDIQTQVIELFKTFKNTNAKQIFNDILTIISEFGLSDSTKKSYEEHGCNSSDGLGKYNKEAYLKLRKDYNETNKNTYRANILFYTLTCYSFSNQIRFNAKNEFNMPYGKRDFNNNMRKNLNNFLEKIHKINIHFTNRDFRNLNYDKLSENDFVYCDPPYLISTATYNENGGWTEKEEKDLLHMLNKLNENNVKFALSNVLIHQGIKNELLTDWAKDYKIHYLNCDYTNCSYHKKDKETKSVEVLITNY